MTRVFQVKICGITRPADAVAAQEAGADAIGLNFFPGSPRCVGDDQAAAIVSVCQPTLLKVGVFVNASLDEIERRVERFGLNWVQLHGDEPPEMLARLTSHSVLRALRLGEDGLTAAVEYLGRCRQLGAEPQAVLLDAWHDRQYGGTGQTLDWTRLQQGIVALGTMPWVLAGGLRADNVGEAIRQLRPSSVDSASGVESSPGVKDAAEIQRFVHAARAAFDAL